jgi:hypothetical protein
MTVGKIKQITFSEGTAVSGDAEFYASSAGLAKYADDAAFVTAKGSAAASGDMYYNTTSNVVKAHNGSAWQVVIFDAAGVAAITQGGTGQTSKTAAFDALAPTTAKGDLVAHDGTDNVRLGVGADGYVLTADATQTTGVKWAPASGGSGSGEKNYVENPSAAENTTGWTNSGLDNFVRGTSTDVPREQTTGTAFRATSDNDEAYCYYRFILDDVDLSKKLKIQFAVNSQSQSDYRVEMWETDQSDYSSQTEIPLSTDSSGDSYIPEGQSVYQTTFDTSTDKFLELRIIHNGTSSGTIDFSDVVVGPGTQPQGAIVTAWQSFTPPSDPSTFTTSSKSGYWRRVGDSIEVRTYWVLNSVVSGTIVFLADDILPNNLTFGTALTRDSVGTWEADDASAAATADDFAGTVQFTSSGLALITGNGQDAVDATAPFTWASGDTLAVRFSVPIAEWAGSGTSNLAQNDCEFAANSSTSDAADTSSFVYGQAGSAFPGALTANRSKRVRFQTPIQASDLIQIEVDPDGVAEWAPIGQSRIGGGNDATHGITWQRVSSSTTDIDVNFGSAGFNATGLTAAAAWSTLASGKWRVRKLAGGQAVGFGAATNTASGLISREINGSFSVAITGPYTSSTTCYYSRVGKSVTLTFPDHFATTTAAAVASLDMTNLPSGLRPVTRQDMGFLIVEDSGALQGTAGKVRITTSGNFTIYRAIGSSGFNNSSTAGWYGFSITYNCA